VSVRVFTSFDFSNDIPARNILASTDIVVLVAATGSIIFSFNFRHALLLVLDLEIVEKVQLVTIFLRNGFRKRRIKKPIELNFVSRRLTYADHLPKVLPEGIHTNRLSKKLKEFMPPPPPDVNDWIALLQLLKNCAITMRKWVIYVLSNEIPKELRVL
jgi:hypothetical protein